MGQGADVRRRSLGYLKKELEIDYHEVPIGTLYNRYGTDPVKVLKRMVADMLHILIRMEHGNHNLNYT